MRCPAQKSCGEILMREMLLAAGIVLDVRTGGGDGWILKPSAIFFISGFFSPKGDLFLFLDMNVKNKRSKTSAHKLTLVSI